MAVLISGRRCGEMIEREPAMVAAGS